MSEMLNNSPVLLYTGATSALDGAARAMGWGVQHVGSDEEHAIDGVTLVEIAPGADLEALKRRYHYALFVSCNGGPVETSSTDVDFYLKLPEQNGLVPQILEHADCYRWKNRKVHELARDVAQRRQRMHQLNEISLALTRNVSQQELLSTILTEARRIAGCEGGSIFLVEENALVFKLAQNDTVEFPFQETRLPLTAESIAGYVAVTGEELNIQDVYELADNLPYRFNRSFDESNGYRTQSVLALPMCDHRDRVVGALQFINHVDSRDHVVTPFGEETAEIMRAIASQAAMSLQKNALLEDINELFESFVQASVKTIEQRDPSTSGHSFRVAETTVALLEALPLSGFSRYKNMELTPQHLREVRYAALLHDFGKIGVPEAILVKKNKLPEERLEVIRYRFELQKERLRRKAVEHEIDLLHHAKIDHEVARRRVYRQLEKQLAILDQYFEWVLAANKPNVMEAGDYAHLTEIRDYEFRELDGRRGSVISSEDIMALSVRRGSLTTEERHQIEAHVQYTKEFLSVLPWPPELADIPDIAGAHHERIDGSGYPMGLVGEEIPLPSRVMAVCDIFDALTAMDRPYKPAVGVERAFSILHDEVKRGLLDEDLVEIFVASGSYRLRETG
ncbi:MAG: HD domain-containing phosphohydrolase [Pseudomonadota bacterium]